MTLDAVTPPARDPAPIFEHFRGSYGTELLVAAVHHLKLFERLGEASMTFDELRAALDLDRRPAVVLFTALRAMKLLEADDQGRLTASDLAREHLSGVGYFDVSDYLGLAAESPGVLAMVERLKTNRAPGAEDGEKGAAFIFRDGIESAMDQQDSARQLTLALAGRAKNVAPLLAARAPLSSACTLLDVGGGTGIYAIACLQKHQNLRAKVLDRPEVLKVAAEFASAYGVADRLELLPGDMFADALQSADAVLLSNVLHDWDEPQCSALVRRCAEAVNPGGRLMIHDVFLNDAMDGPLPIALYSASLFSLTEGRAYSAAEYRAWLSEAGLTVEPIIPTLVHCGILCGVRT